MHQRKEVGCGGMTGGVEEPDPRRGKREGKERRRGSEREKVRMREEKRRNDLGKGRRA